MVGREAVGETARVADHVEGPHSHTVLPAGVCRNALVVRPDTSIVTDANVSLAYLSKADGHVAPSVLPHVPVQHVPVLAPLL